MGLCQQRACGCAITSSSLIITGDGGAGNPWTIDGASPKLLTEAQRLALTGGTNLYEGAFVWTIDRRKLWVYSSSVWQAVAGRTNFTGVSVQTVAANTNVDITNYTEFEDTDSYYPSSGVNVTIPPLLAGKYMISFSTQTGTGFSSIGNVVLYLNGGLAAANSIPVGAGAASCARTISLSAGDLIKASLYNGHSAALTFTNTIEVVKIGL